MNVATKMYIVKCPNQTCGNLIRLSEGKYLGGFNDRGGVIVKCDQCSKIFPSKLNNPYDASGIISGGFIVDKWTDSFPKEFESKYSISKSDINSIERILVFNYEKPPKANWSNFQKPIYSNSNFNLEKIAFDFINKNKKKINNQYRLFFNYYVKGKCNVQKSFVKFNYKYAGENYSALLAKEIETEEDCNTDNLYLINHSKVEIEKQIDGIYTKTECLEFLERFLNRWRFTANEVLLVVPFIGYHYKNSQEALKELWEWLEINIDINKTNLVTRKGTFNLFKKAQDNSGIPYEILVEWGLLEPLIESMEKNQMKYFQKSHAKYYVGVYNDYVEVLSGSFNIHKGPSFENITFKKYSKDFFKERYLHMFDDFEYADSNNDEYIHYIDLGGDNEYNNCRNYNLDIFEL